MDFEDFSPELPAPDLPDAESFTPIESVGELSPEPGSTFDVMDREGANVMESGTILGLTDDENYAGGGFFQVELEKDGAESRAGKLTYDKFLEFYNDERISAFQNPSEKDGDDGILAAIDREFAVPENQGQDNQLPERIVQLDPELDPQFASYLGEVIDRRGIDQIKEVVGRMTDDDRQTLQREMASGNLPGFTSRMELIFDQETDPNWEKRHLANLDDSLSGDPGRARRAMQTRAEQLGKQVEMTGRHLQPQSEDEADLQAELALLLSQLTGKKIEGDM